EGVLPQARRDVLQGGDAVDRGRLRGGGAPRLERPLPDRDPGEQQDEHQRGAHSARCALVSHGSPSLGNAAHPTIAHPEATVGENLHRASGKPGLARDPRRILASMARQQIRFCTAPDGVRIAYAISGEGPPLLKAANWLNHLEYDWESPVWRRWLEEVSRHHTLIRYDERGCGLSDWEVEDLSFESWVSDLETVAQ